jgi:hypothetical protein
MIIVENDPRDVGRRSWMMILATGDEVKASLLEFARRERISGVSFYAVGAFERAELAYFEWSAKKYRPIKVDEQTEVVSLIGNVVPGEADEYIVHAHATLGLADGGTRGGHLNEGHVRPTLEITILETPAGLRRKMNVQVGIPLITHE